MSRFNWAPAAYRLLDGLFCVFKPSGVSVQKVIHSVKLNLCKDLNALPCYEHEIVFGQQAVSENLTEKSLSLNAEPAGITDWSEHRLVLGDRYEESDFSISFVDGLAKSASGVLVMSIGKFGRQSLDMVAMSKFLRVYHVKGRLGYATDNFTPTGTFLERTSFRHVSQSKLTRLCAAAQAAHTRQMYNLHGVNPDSQEAYEMAARGIIRPSERKTMPVLYSIKCIDFQPPDFTLEVHSINETTSYLQRLVHDLALKLKSSAVCTGVRRLRYGYFDLDRALLRQHWHLDPIVDNVQGNMNLLTPERLFVGAETVEFEALPLSKPDGYLAGSSLIGESEDNFPSLEDKTGGYLGELGLLKESCVDGVGDCDSDHLPTNLKDSNSQCGNSFGERPDMQAVDQAHNPAVAVEGPPSVRAASDFSHSHQDRSGDSPEQMQCKRDEELVVVGKGCKLHSPLSSSSEERDKSGIDGGKG